MRGVGCWILSLGSFNSCNKIQSESEESGFTIPSTYLWPYNSIVQTVLKRREVVACKNFETLKKEMGVVSASEKLQFQYSATPLIRFSEERTP